MKRLAAISLLFLLAFCTLATAQQPGNNSGPKPDGIALDGLKDFGRDLQVISNQWQGTVKSAADQLPKVGTDAACNLQPYLVALTLALVFVGLAIGFLGLVSGIGLFMDNRKQI